MFPFNLLNSRMQNEGANVKAEINKRKIEIERLKGLQNMARPFNYDLKNIYKKGILF